MEGHRSYASTFSRKKMKSCNIDDLIQEEAIDLVNELDDIENPTMRRNFWNENLLNEPMLRKSPMFIN